MAGRVIETEAEARGAKLFRAGHEWSAHAETSQLVYASPAGSRKFPLPALPGPHQIGNAGLAIAGLEKLSEFKVLDSHIVTGLRMVDWPARIQHLTRGPLVDLLPEGWELWLDGGHNAAAGEMLAAVAADWDAQPLHLVLGMLDSKDPAAFLAPLVTRTSGLQAVVIPEEDASLSADALVRAAASLGLASAEASSVTDAVRRIVIDTHGPARILICGSLYLAGQVLAENG